MFLDRIVVTKREEVQQLREELNINDAERRIAGMPTCRGFAQALSVGRHRPMGLIAEVKKASPSKGLIRPDFSPVELAKSYERAGTDCISVLTDVSYFQGANEYLTQIKQEVRVPLLRKDFIIDPLQIYEARLIGADAILLIAAILSQEQMKNYMILATDLGLDALIEVHDRNELESVLDLGLDTQLIGINNRNLRTFETSLETTAQLIDLIPKHVTIVSESGISQAADIDWLTTIGAKAVLVGEHFMRQPNVEEAVSQLLGRTEVR